jgi:O-methyltransferase
MGMTPKRRMMLHRLEIATNEWYADRTPSEFLPDRESLLDYSVKHIGKDTDVRYLEFGVASGWCMNYMIRKFLNPRSHFVGFDSFEGLPEPWVTSDGPAGQFDMGGRIPPIKDPRVEFVKGWFQNTVGDFLIKLKSEPKKITLVQFDADLYSSTLFLLTAFWWNIPEYYFIFDEFHNEELIALYDFVAAYPIDIEFYAATNNIHGQPMQIFGKLRNAPLVITRSPASPEEAPA